MIIYIYTFFRVSVIPGYEGLINFYNYYIKVEINPVG